MADDFLGGGGGSAFTPVVCPPGQVVIGLVGKAGAVLNTIQLVCANPLHEEHDPSQYPALPTVITSVDTNPDPKDPNSEAARGGGSAQAYCPMLTAAKQIEVSMKMWRRHYAVSQIKLTCAHPADGSFAGPPKVFGNDDGIGRVPATSASTVNRSDVRSCPEHQLMNGLQGRHSTWIDAVGINCVATATLNGH